MKKWVFIVMGCFFATGAWAESTGFQLSLTPDLAIHSRATRISGVTIGVWSENPQDAIALGIVNGSTGQSSGLSLGLLANYAENYKGAQLAWLANYTSGRFAGFQWSAFNYAGNLHGFQLGLINFADTCDKGLQVGLINLMNETEIWFRNFPNEVAPAMILLNWRY